MDVNKTNLKEITPKQNSYPAISSEIKRQTIRRISDAQHALLRRWPDKIDINDTETVQQISDDYQESCKTAGVCPTFEGLCAAIGVSRQWGYDYLQSHPDTPTAMLLNRLRVSWAALRMALAESGAISEASAIFILKNSGHGLTDRQEIVIEPKQITPLSDLEEDAVAARRRIMDSIPADDDGDFNA